jgi:hypothetical protein
MSENAAIVLLISGALAAGYSVASLFFLRFWRQSRDRIFLFFATSFALLMIQRITLALAVQNDSGTIASYVLRLAAFLIILAGIIDKNRSSGG